MKELAIKFDELTSNYSEWISNMEKKETLVGYTSIDFFSFEPFYPELNNLSEDSFQFYPDIESLPEGDVYSINIEEGKIAFSRLYCGKDIYYDSFFFYSEGEKWRYQIYVNPNEKKPIFIEKLEFDEYNRPLKFQRYDTYAYREQTYSHLETGCEIEVQHKSKTGESHSKEQLLVKYQDGKIFTIENSTRKESLYNLEQKGESLEGLLKKCHEHLVEQMITGVKKAEINTPNICALLIEYNLQHVFPPSIGFAQEKEKEFDADKYTPLSWLNAPDMELFFECEFFYENEDGLYDEVNARLTDLKFEEQKKIAFDFYENLCRTLQQSNKLNELIHTTSDYFVSACDFEEGNHWEFLEALLPKKLLNKFEQENEEYANDKEEKLENDEEYQAVISTLTFAQNELSSYETELEKLNCSIGYNDKLLYSIKPFYSQLKHKTAENNIIEALTEKPEGSTYYRYQYYDNQIVHITYYSDDKFIFQIYFQYQKELIEMVKYYGDPSQNEQIKLESYDKLIIESGKFQTYQNYSNLSFDENKYDYDENNQIVQVNESQFMYSKEDSLKFDTVHWIKEIKYTQNNEVKRITSTPVGHQKRTVVYSIDDSFVLEEINTISKLSADLIIENLKKRKTLPKAICFNVNSSVCFPSKIYFKSEKQWTDQHNLYSSFWQDKKIENSPFTYYVYHDKFRGEGAYFSIEQCENYIDQAYESICKALEKQIHQTFDTYIQVLFKGELDSFEGIEEKLV